MLPRETGQDGFASLDNPSRLAGMHAEEAWATGTSSILQRSFPSSVVAVEILSRLFIKSTLDHQTFASAKLSCSSYCMAT